MARKVAVTVIEFLEDTPIVDEAYALLTDGTRFAFAWGPTYSGADDVPVDDVLDGESGIQWFDTEAEAREAMEAALEAVATNRGE